MGIGAIQCCTCRDDEGRPDKDAVRKRMSPHPSPEIVSRQIEIKPKLVRDNSHFSHSFIRDNPGRVDDYYEIDKQFLGTGAFGVVSQAKQKVTGAARAIKSLPLSKFSTAREIARFHAEVQIMKAMDHPHIVKLHEKFQDSKFVYLVMELCSGGELFDRLVEDYPDGFSEEMAASIVRQSLSAVYYMHNIGVVHRDIKPENFLMQDRSKDADVKLIDFGLATLYSKGQRLRTQTGTPYYIAPEVLKGSYTNLCDVWSCGVIAYILLCGFPPFSGKDHQLILRAVKAGRFQFKSPFWDDVSDEAKQFIQLALTYEDYERPEASMLLTNKWLQVHQHENEFERPPTPSLERKRSGGSILVSKLQRFNAQRKLKKVCLTVIATQLRYEEIESLREQFKALDTNGDGTISHQELLAGVGNTVEKMGLSDADLDPLIMAIDSDGSGSIDYTEFIAAVMDRQMYQKRDVLWSAFRTFDLDGDGKITKEELTQVLANDGVAHFSDDKLETMIAEIDQDGDGCIDFEEFMNMMTSSPAARKTFTIELERSISPQEFLISPPSRSTI